MKKQAIILSLGLLLVGFISVYAQKGHTVSKANFQDPGGEYKPMPFWHMNGELTEPEILRQMEDAAAAGFSGLAILPAHSTRPDFLSPTFFKRYKFILETAKKMDLNIILYDDTGFPSGIAGGRIEREYPQHLRKNLEKVEYNVTKLPYWKCIVKTNHYSF